VIAMSGLVKGYLGLERYISYNISVMDGEMKTNVFYG